MRVEIDFKAPGLQPLKHKAMENFNPGQSMIFLYVKRDCNASADKLASEALQNEIGGIVIDDNDRQDLVTLNRLDELMISQKKNQ